MKRRPRHGHQRLTQRLVLRRVGVHVPGRLLRLDSQVVQQLGLAAQLRNPVADHVHASHCTCGVDDQLHCAGRPCGSGFRPIAREFVGDGFDTLAVAFPWPQLR